MSGSREAFLGRQPIVGREGELIGYELLYRAEIPKNVTINEAIEIAKKFGSEESPAFVNGILDEIARELPEK